MHCKNGIFIGYSTSETKFSDIKTLIFDVNRLLILDTVGRVIVTGNKYS